MATQKIQEERVQNLNEADVSLPDLARTHSQEGRVGAGQCRILLVFYTPDCDSYSSLPDWAKKAARRAQERRALDVCCVDSVRDRKGAIIVSPHQGAKDGPTQPYPTPRRDGRGPHRPVLPHRRRLRSSQPPRPLLRIHKAPLGLGSHRPRPLPAAAGRREPTLFLARRRKVLLPPVPRGGGAAPFSSFHRRLRK